MTQLTGMTSHVVMTSSDRTIGVSRPVSNNQTRRAHFSARRLVEWAKQVQEAQEDEFDDEVVVELTPEKPLMAKSSEDAEIGIALAPIVPGGDTDE